MRATELEERACIEGPFRLRNGPSMRARGRFAQNVLISISSIVNLKLKSALFHLYHAKTFQNHSPFKTGERPIPSDRGR